MSRGEQEIGMLCCLLLEVWMEQGSMRQYLACIGWYHKCHIGIDLTASPDFTVLLQGIKRLSQVHKLQPITLAFLRLLYRRIDIQQPQHRLLIFLPSSEIGVSSDRTGQTLLLPQTSESIFLGRRREVPLRQLNSSNEGQGIQDHSKEIGVCFEVDQKLT
ncbi:hypothetical protein PHMEG_00019762 [Phytophthora megakarya]|uniref:Uncharacterized protein n=1 Tax=Phytophthora megakarya TaxID=4795 RepID=A0A225VR41_9STRA|nr:hypothetical protein PHMEG_00019762 [Phytophthora megakarya]